MKGNGDFRPLSARGRFFVCTPDGVQVHLLTDIALEGYYQGLAIAADSSKPEEHEKQIKDSTFRCNTLAVLPAPGLEALLWLMDRYEGPHETTVRGYAAALILGQPLHGDNWGGDIDGGTPVPVPKPLPQAPRPGGAVFDREKSNTLTRVT